MGKPKEKPGASPQFMAVATHRYIGTDPQHNNEPVVYIEFDAGDCLHKVSNEANEVYYVPGTALGPLNPAA